MMTLIPIMMTLIPIQGAETMPREIAFEVMKDNSRVGRQLQRSVTMAKIRRGSTSSAFATQKWVTGMLSFLQLPRPDTVLTSLPSNTSVAVVLASHALQSS
jgi:hypothetical protein